MRRGGSLGRYGTIKARISSFRLPYASTRLRSTAVAVSFVYGLSALFIRSGTGRLPHRSRHFHDYNSMLLPRCECESIVVAPAEQSLGGIGDRPSGAAPA